MLNMDENVKYRGLLGDKIDERDFSAEALVGDPSEIPSKVDLSIGMVVNQGQCGSCTAHASTACHEITNSKEHGETALDAYKLWSHQEDNGAHCDKGDYLKNSVQELKEHGSVSIDGKKYPIKKYARIYDKRPSSFIKYLARGLPIMIGLYSRDGNGNVIWDRSNGEHTGGRGSQGGHAMCLVGYDDSTQKYKIRNSWGEDWGDNGYCYLPYDYLTENVYNSIYIIYDAMEMLYKDVSQEAWYAEAVKWVTDSGYMSVDEDDRFNPEQPINRAMMAQILFNMHREGKL